MAEDRAFDFIVVGGGIAAVTCAEYLAFLDERATICVISSSYLIKTVCNVRNITRNLSEFDVVEKPLDALSSKCSNVTVYNAAVISLDHTAHQVEIEGSRKLLYKKVCICSGARPKLISPDNPHVIGLRDIHSIQVLQNRLSSARKVAVVGNGGIALELVYELKGCEVIWVIKDDSIGNTYFDKGAAQFFLESAPFKDEKDESNDSREMNKPEKPVHRVENSESHDGGAALGHNWITFFNNDQNIAKNRMSNVHIVYNCEVADIMKSSDYDSSVCCGKVDWDVYVKLTNGDVFGCDFVISATGVVPNSDIFKNSLDIAGDGGLMVDDHMRTSVVDVYAAGDVCTAAWPHSGTWFQMRLWTQAAQMGAYAAKCMLADINCEPTPMDFCFELFAHATRFFGLKVIMLGKYNGQGLDNEYQILLRCTKGQEYIKVILKDGKIMGALLIGETGLEETFENLILNQMDVSCFGEDLLNPDVDIEDFFD